MNFNNEEILAVADALHVTAPKLKNHELLALPFLQMLARKGWALVPAVECPDCMGKGCEECNQTGMEIF
jgi:hypothetical protein